MDTAKTIDQNGHDVSDLAPPEKRARQVTPSVVQLDLTDGDWIRVKAELNFGEQRRLTTAGLTDMAEGGDGQRRVGVDFAAFGHARMLAYLVEWSFVDERGRRIPVNGDTLDALTVETAAEIAAALDAHVEGIEARKNALSAERK